METISSYMKSIRHKDSLDSNDQTTLNFYRENLKIMIDSSKKDIEQLKKQLCQKESDHAAETKLFEQVENSLNQS